MEHIRALQVGCWSIGSPSKAPSALPVNPVKAAVPDIATGPDEQSTIQDFPKTVFGQL